MVMLMIMMIRLMIMIMMVNIKMIMMTLIPENQKVDDVRDGDNADHFLIIVNHNQPSEDDDHDPGDVGKVDQQDHHHLIQEAEETAA